MIVDFEMNFLCLIKTIYLPGNFIHSSHRNSEDSDELLSVLGSY